MNRPPAFQFYPKDFLMDDKVAAMNLKETGAYIKLLCYCWNNNGLTKNQEELKNMCGNPRDWEHIWGKVGKCFYEKKGKFYNKRLEKEYRKQQAWRKKSQLGGIQSGVSRRGMVEPNVKGSSQMVATKGQPKGNSSVSSLHSSFNNKDLKDVCSENNSPNPPKPKTYKYKENHMIEAKYLESAIKATSPKHTIQGGNYLESWANTFRIMEEKKEATIDEIRFIIDFAMKDKFWYRNILSATKLRKQFGRLWEDARQEWEKKKHLYVGKNK